MFLLSLIWAWTAWNIYRPYRRSPELLGVISFIFGVIVGEFGLHVIAVEVALTVLIMAQAVRDALGLNPDQPLNTSDSLQISPDLKRLLKPFAYRLPGVTRHKNIEYCTVNGRSLKLDIYHRDDLPENAPVLYQMHGGAWLENCGSKNEQALPLMNQLAANGWVCVASADLAG